jgi:DNA segregation ATPase FtsK/SpoIIIE, S-DNA-T family
MREPDVAARTRTGTTGRAKASGAKASGAKAAKASGAKASGGSKRRGATGSTRSAAAAERGPGVVRRGFGWLGQVLSEHRRDVWTIVLLLSAVITGLGVYLAAAGPVGAGLTTFALGTFGLAGYLLPVVLLAFGALLAFGRPGPEVGRVGLGTALIGLAGLAGAHLTVDIPGPGEGVEVLATGGGLIGWLVAAPLDAALSRAGAWAVVVALAVLGIVIASRLGLRTIGSGFARTTGGLWVSLRDLLRRAPAAAGDPALADGPATPDELVLEPSAVPVDGSASDVVDVPPLLDIPLDDVAADLTVELEAVDVQVLDTQPIALVAADGSDDADPDATADAPRDETAPVRKARKVLPPGDEPPYELPPLDLLSAGRASGGDPAQAIAEQSRALQSTFDQFGIDAKVVRTSRGPTVTRFEVEVGPGVKVNKVANLGDDIAYALAAPDVRIVAPIPGKSAIGIEVPNIQRDLIALGDILRSDVARTDEHPLSVALGVDIAGAPVMIDLTTMPHLLVSGATGSGKSVTLNGMIASILMRARPDQVRMLLIDPKRVELGVYDGAPHLLAPVVTDPRRATDAVQWCVKEMEQRYELLALLGFRNIDGYNDAYDRGALESRPGKDGGTIEPKRLPYVLLVIDELADLMLVAPRDVEDAICRIAQMARAVGIHMVIATQRPSVDVITGLIKANIPSRLALAVASQTDSRTILDAGGAEKLVGRGDMLFLPASQGKPSRLQGCWVTEEEIASVVSYCRTQREPVFEEAVLRTDDATRSHDGARSGGGGDDDDAGLVRRAAEQVVASGLGSTSMLQRKLRVGFARAGRLMDELEQVGCVGPSEGSKAREVLWSPEQLEAALEQGLI